MAWVALKMPKLWLHCRLALDWGLLNCQGKTPEATMASSMYGDIKRKDRRSIFIRCA